MTGTLWAAAAGIGFGLFQSFNRRAMAGVGSAYVSTFLQLLIAAVVLTGACLATEDLGQLGETSAWPIAAFALAGIVHFLLGWTFLNLSQERIGAARTSPLLTMAPIFGLVVAAVALGELPSGIAAVGIAVAVAGALVVTRGDTEMTVRPIDTVFGLTTALMWSLSPLLTIEGLDGLDAPLLGVTIGIYASAVAYAVLIAASRTPLRFGGRDAVSFKLLAGTLVALATWWRFIALDSAAVAPVLTLNLLNVPVVLIVAPMVSGRHVERVTRKIWLGAVLVMAGALILILES